MSFKKTLVKQNSLILANKNISLTKYVDSVRKKHDEDEDCAKWDTSLPLPKLPVPELEMSLKKYLRCIMPIISEDAYAKTESIVKDFSNPGGIGEKLQQILLKTAEEKDNWAYDWWLEDMYMMNKLALPINSNPGMIFPTENFINEDAQLKFVARLISGIMDYKLIIDAGSLPIDRCTCREKGQPLCMEQYYRLFSSYRLPGIEKDKLIDSSELCNCLEDEQAEHIIVISLNQIFVLDVVFNLVRLTEEQVYQQLKRIKRQSEEDLNTSNAHADVGFLTSLPRDKWAQARCELIKEPVNQECLDLIERCIFVICLDKKVKNSSRHRENSNSINETLEYVSLSDENKENQLQENNIEQDISKSMTPIAFQMLHGCNSKNNSGNRWFDKTMQFIISEDGLCGLNYEHSPSEGIAVIELSEHLFRYMNAKKEQKLKRIPSVCELPVPKKLKWKLNETMCDWINLARVNFDKQIEDLDFCLLKYTKFGRDFPKKVKMSPDSFVQLAMQLAYFKLYNKLVSTYESASTRRFRKGRVDNIRANSWETLQWVKSMQPNSSQTKEEKFALFQKAVEYQTDLMIQSILGKGMDCHLLALKCIAEENNFEIPELFTDDSYRISNYFQLSTSQIPTTMEGSFMCYGPVVPDGYGCSYNPKPNYIIFAISSFKSCSATSTKLFSDSLKNSLNEMYDLCSSFA